MKVQLDKVDSIDTHEVHLSTILTILYLTIFILSSLCLSTYIYNYVVLSLQHNLLVNRLCLLHMCNSNCLLHLHNYKL